MELVAGRKINRVIFLFHADFNSKGVWNMVIESYIMRCLVHKASTKIKSRSKGKQLPSRIILVDNLLSGRHYLWFQSDCMAFT